MLAALAAWVLAVPADLTFVRHAETIANATGRYNARTLNAFSRKGEAQVVSLTKELLKLQPFEVVLVSPSPRALKTILPYLKATGRKATIEPLLYECCTGRRTSSKATSFRWGARISLPAGFEQYFDIVAGKERLPVAPGWGPGLAQVRQSVAEFRQSSDGMRVLMVGHSGHGGQFLHALTGKRYHVKNAEPIKLSF